MRSSPLQAVPATNVDRLRKTTEKTARTADIKNERKKKKKKVTGGSLAS